MDLVTPATTERKTPRAVYFGVAGGCFAVLIAAAWLTPDPRGFGTHEQLGLPACISNQFLGLPCPLCGMTTSFALMADARFGQAFATQPAGASLFIGTIIMAAGALVSGVAGFVPPLVLRVATMRSMSMLAVALMLAAWAYKIVYG